MTKNSSEQAAPADNNRAANQAVDAPAESPQPSASTDRKNLLALGSGSFVIAKTSEHSADWRALNLIDELPGVGWAGGE